MKQAIFLLLTGLTTNMGNLNEPVIKVARVFTDVQIRQAEQQAFQQYGVKAQVKVIERNSKKEITNLTCVLYNKVGKETGSCASDNFGLLIITRDGCKIAEPGYESQI